MSIMLPFFLLTTIAIAAEQASAAATAPWGSGPPFLWPFPSSMAGIANATLCVNPIAFAFTTAPGTVQSDVLTAAFDQYLAYMRAPPRIHTTTTAEAENTAPTLAGLIVSVVNNSAAPRITEGTDESYPLALTPPPGGARLSAPTAFGALRGVETFLQLMVPTHAAGDDPAWATAGACPYSVPAPVVIEDRPRFGHRGMLVDTGRQYFPVDTLLHAIDAMMFNKLNVLHWHITEVNSFPIVLDSVPELARAGAYAPSEVYTKVDIAKIVDYARLHGVRVVPELDMPGHMTSWGRANPAWVIDCGPKHHQLHYRIANVANPDVYRVIESVIDELAPLFPDPWWFFGGDETCCTWNTCDGPGQKLSGWMQDPAVAAWTRRVSGQPGYEANMSSHAAIFRHFAEQVEPMVLKHGKTPVWWNDAFQMQATRKTSGTSAVFENWLSTDLAPYLQEGFRVIQGRGWYLSSLHAQGTPGQPESERGNGDWEFCSFVGGNDWTTYYLNDPARNVSAPALNASKLLLGGEVSAWGECIDPGNFDAMAWPKGSAVAERLWSPAAQADPTEAWPRLVAHRCRMKRRGVAAQVLHPQSCYSPHAPFPTGP